MTAEDRIYLRGLKCQCIIGFIDWERQVRQTVVIDLEFPTRAGASDLVEDTVDYKQLAKRVVAFVEGSSFNLIETLADRLAAVVLNEFSLEWIKIDLTKPGAIRHSRDVGVGILRRRADLTGAN
jgi:7,8-dihydroneopterin aldolase/epimerase/oxygenase